jgi:hypothetical protein
MRLPHLPANPIVAQACHSAFPSAVGKTSRIDANIQVPTKI